jgi:DNA-binding Lrp family transcriptional regulator
MMLVDGRTNGKLSKSQNAFAEELGVTQAWASQVLKRLRDSGRLRRTRKGSKKSRLSDSYMLIGEDEKVKELTIAREQQKRRPSRRGKVRTQSVRRPGAIGRVQFPARYGQVSLDAIVAWLENTPVGQRNLHLCVASMEIESLVLAEIPIDQGWRDRLIGACEVNGYLREAGRRGVLAVINSSVKKATARDLVNTGEGKQHPGWGHGLRCFDWLAGYRVQKTYIKCCLEGSLVIEGSCNARARNASTPPQAKQPWKGPDIAVVRAEAQARMEVRAKFIAENRDAIAERRVPGWVEEDYEHLDEEQWRKSVGWLCSTSMPTREN